MHVIMLSMDWFSRIKKEATKTLKAYIEKKLQNNSGCFGSLKIETGSFTELMGMILGAKPDEYCRDYNSCLNWYYNGFDAPYSWIEILNGAFLVLKPFLGNGSEYYVKIDEEFYKYKIIDGDCILVSQSK